MSDDGFDSTPWIAALQRAGQVFEVGGSVRDERLGLPVRERDYVVRGLPLARVTEILEAFGAVALVGSSFGVLKFRPAGGGKIPIDIALPRVERSTGSGHADFQVAFDPALPIERDLGRRDFTINAMAKDLATGALVDPHGGRADLDAGVIRMLFEETFLEDPLRILRGARFAGQLEFTIEAETRTAMCGAAARVAHLSPERIGEELGRILTRCRRPSRSLEILREVGVLERILPELVEGVGVDQHPYHREDVYRHALTTCDLTDPADLELRWSALLHDIGKARTRAVTGTAEGGTRTTFYGHERVGAHLAEEILARMRGPTELREGVAHLVREHMYHYNGEWSDGTVRRFVRRVGRDRLQRLFRLRAADRAAKGDAPDDPLQAELETRIDRVLEADVALTVRDLAVGGREVMAATGLGPGPRVGRVLDHLLERVLDEPSQNEPETLLRLAQEMVLGGEGKE